MGDEAEPVRVFEHARRHLGHAAELARQRPLGAGAVAEDAAEHPGAGRGAGDLLDLDLAVDREQAHAARDRRAAMSRSFLIVLPKEMRSAVAPAASTISISADRRGVERRAELGEELQDLRRRVGLDRVEDARVRQRLGESQVVLADDFEVDDKAGAVVASSSEKLADTFSHFSFLHSKSAETAGPRMRSPLGGAYRPRRAGG